jgi:hypothetical protein
VTVVGFTGTRNGMTPQQYATLLRFLLYWQPIQAHHGSCLGADFDFHKLLVESVPSVKRITIHPCDLYKQQANCAIITRPDLIIETREVLKPLSRNMVIMLESALLLAIPSGFIEAFVGSGTWATVRYSRKAHKPRLVIYPDGSPDTEKTFPFPSYA